MAKKKIYGVAVGKIPGIYEEWYGPDGCEAQVKGYTGAKYKGFEYSDSDPASKQAALEECKIFVESGGPGGGAKSTNVRAAKAGAVGRKKPSDGSEFYEKGRICLGEKEAIAFVDGGRKTDGGSGKTVSGIGYAAIIYEDLGGVPAVYAGYLPYLDDAPQSYLEVFEEANIIGEAYAAHLAMKYAINRGLKKLILVQDYNGVMKTCVDRWKVKSVSLTGIRDYYDNEVKAAGVQVEFVHVKSHMIDKSVFANYRDSMSPKEILSTLEKKCNSKREWSAYKGEIDARYMWGNQNADDIAELAIDELSYSDGEKEWLVANVHDFTHINNAVFEHRRCDQYAELARMI